MSTLRWTRHCSLVVLVAACCSPPESLERIVFVSDRDGNREIYSIRPDGTDPVNLTRDGARDQSPTVSDDGSRIAFLSDRGGVLGVWMMNRDGSNPTHVADLPDADFGMDWSPDGTRLAVTLDRGGDEGHDIAVLDLETGLVTSITDSPGHEEITPAWSPDGTALYYVEDEDVLDTERDSRRGPSRLVVLNTSDGTRRVLPLPGVGSAAFPQVSPDGTSVLLRSRTGDQFDVVRVDLLTGQVTTVTDDPADDWGASWSRDGRSIVFASDRHGDMDIYIMQLSDGMVRRVTSSTARDWMPTR